MKILFTLIIFLSCTSTMRSQSNFVVSDNNVEPNNNKIEIRQADSMQLITKVDSSVLKIKYTEVRQADPSQIIIGTDPTLLKIKNPIIKQADPSQIIVTTDPSLLKTNYTSKVKNSESK